MSMSTAPNALRVGDWVEERPKAKSKKLPRTGVVVGLSRSNAEVLLVSVWHLSLKLPQLKTFGSVNLLAQSVRGYRGTKTCSAQDLAAMFVELLQASADSISAQNGCQSNAAAEATMEEDAAQSKEEDTVAVRAKAAEEAVAVAESKEGEASAARIKPDMEVVAKVGADNRAVGKSSKEAVMAKKVDQESAAKLEAVEPLMPVPLPSSSNTSNAERARAVEWAGTSTRRPHEDFQPTTPTKKLKTIEEVSTPEAHAVSERPQASAPAIAAKALRGEVLRGDVQVQFFVNGTAHRMGAETGRISRKGLQLNWSANGITATTRGLARIVEITSDNIMRIHDRFVAEGKATFTLEEDIENSGDKTVSYVMISKADPAQLSEMIRAFRG